MSIRSLPASSADAARPTAHQALRAGTGPAHERLDALFGDFDLTNRDSYGRFLTAHAAALLAVETALDQAGMADLLADWPARHRADAIAADLAALGLDMPPPLAFAAPAGPAAAWGAAYVVEGSRLGGTLLARGVPAGLPTAYLGTPQPKGAWRSFLAQLDDALDDPATHPAAIAAALDVFALFDTAGRKALAQ